MRVLVACEYSGTVRDEFLRLGHDAWSCDILPSESTYSTNHYQTNVLDVLGMGWDLMVAHPPCTYLSYAAKGHGNDYWNNPERTEKREQALDFFMTLYNAPIPKVCVENPLGYPNTVFRKADQTIHPYFFGEAEVKRTCLWLKGLPKLEYAETIIEKPEPFFVTSSGAKMYFIEKAARLAPSADLIGKYRSKFFAGIAKAMASQWGGVNCTNTSVS